MDEIKLIAEPSLADPQVCKVTVIGRDLLPGQILVCEGAQQAEGSPILEALFAIEGIERVMVAENVLTLQKSGDTPWQILGRSIGTAIRTALNLDQPLFSEKHFQQSQKLDEEPDLTTPEARRVWEVLEHQVNPAIASHGGRVRLVGVQDKKVFVRMEGGCQGCGMAMVTLRQGVEVMIKEALPEIEEVVDVTDHSKGTNPYYPSQVESPR